MGRELGALLLLPPLAPDLPLAAADLTALLQAYPEQRADLIRTEGAVPLLELLEMARGTAASPAILALVAATVRGHRECQDAFLLLGGLPALTSYLTDDAPPHVCALVSQILTDLMATLGDTALLRQLVQARALPALVALLRPPAPDQVAPLYWALDLVHKLLHAALGLKKNDLCRIWARSSLLPALVRVLDLLCAAPADPDRDRALLRAADILLVFARADLTVKRTFCAEKALRPLILLLPRLLKGGPERALLLLLLKALYSVSTDSRTLDQLQACAAVPTLIALLHAQLLEEAASRYVLMALFNLCRLVQSRQVEAARSGLLPHLQQVVASNSTSKQFALPLLCELTRTRPLLPELWHLGPAFYVRLFEQAYPWQVQAVDSLASWLAAEPERVSAVLLECAAPAALVRLFVSVQGEAFLNLLEPVLRWLQHAPQLALALVAADFLGALRDKLAHATPNALARVNLLKILKALHDSCASAQRPFPAADFEPLLRQLSTDRAVLVAEMATQLQRALGTLN